MSEPAACIFNTGWLQKPEAALAWLKSLLVMEFLQCYPRLLRRWLTAKPVLLLVLLEG